MRAKASEPISMLYVTRDGERSSESISATSSFASSHLPSQHKLLSIILQLTTFGLNPFDGKSLKN
ncbi:hypothetical protein NC651_004443 [Populus alba x Populus x berolinensis]|nr:hypothetical protein NC651_004443 [Populus alba x Populus x berolinensis]